jgi:hypothetical protein
MYREKFPVDGWKEGRMAKLADIFLLFHIAFPLSGFLVLDFFHIPCAIAVKVVVGQSFLLFLHFLQPTLRFCRLSV